MDKAVDVFKMPVHPAADLLPMLSAERLASLAEGIKAIGLIHPIVIKDGVLIDGRNRREACRLAGVVPTTMELNGVDLVDYIANANDRRDHTQGQRSMW